MGHIHEQEQIQALPQGRRMSKDRNRDSRRAGALVGTDSSAPTGQAHEHEQTPGLLQSRHTE